MEEKPKVSLIGGKLGIASHIANYLAQTTGDMQVYKNVKTEEITSEPPSDSVFTIHEVKYDKDYKSGRENRRIKRQAQRRKEQRKKK